MLSNAFSREIPKEAIGITMVTLGKDFIAFVNQLITYLKHMSTSFT